MAWPNFAMYRRPVPPDLKVRDLNPAERLCMQCPDCGREIGKQCYSLGLELPPESLVLRYVTRHLCRRCSRPGRPVRAMGWLEAGPRSGAEGYRSRG